MYIILHTYFFYMWSKKLLGAKDFSGDDIYVWMNFFLWKKDKIKKSEWLEVVTSDVSILWWKLKFKEGDIVKVINKRRVKYEWGDNEFHEITFIVERSSEPLKDEKWIEIQYVFNANLLIHHLFPVSDLSQVILLAKEEVWEKVDTILKQ